MKTLIVKTKGEFLDAIQDLETKIKNSLGYTVDYVLSDLEEIEKDLTTLKNRVAEEREYNEETDDFVIPEYFVFDQLVDIIKKVELLKNELKS